MLRYENKIHEIQQLKKELDAHKPLSRDILNGLKEYYRIGLTYTSNALQGNSLTEIETKIIIEDGIAIGGKLIREHLEVLGHSDAYTLLYKLAANNNIREKDIRDLHKAFYVKIDQKRAGKYRTRKVFIMDTDFVPPAPDRIREHMHDFVEQMPQLKQQYDPIVFATHLHLKLIAIRPFTDGNGRCARLLMNLALLQAGYPITIIPPVVRADYFEAHKIAQTTKNTEPFINFISTMVYEAQKDQLRILQHVD